MLAGAPLTSNSTDGADGAAHNCRGAAHSDVMFGHAADSTRICIFFQIARRRHGGKATYSALIRGFCAPIVEKIIHDYSGIGKIIGMIIQNILYYWQ